MPPLGIEKFDRRRTFDKDYKKLPQKVQKKAKRALTDLMLPDEDFPAWRDLKKRNPKQRNLWQIRVDPEYRITFKVDEGLCILYRIGTHKTIHTRDD